MQNIQTNPKGLQNFQQPQQKKLIQVFFKNKARSVEKVVDKIASIKDFVDIYCWYENPVINSRDKTISISSLEFYRDKLFEPLWKKKSNLKLWLYSLKGWKFEKNVSEMRCNTCLGQEINKINMLFVECIYAFSFFRYCNEPKPKGLQKFFDEELKNKKWLFEISKDKDGINKKIEEFFGSESSLFRSINGMNVTKIYSLIQYVEGYYLVRESVERGLSNNRKKIEIAFVLQNDEYKYYQDFPKDIEIMLKEDFGDRIDGVEITITFQFFAEGKESWSRLYLDSSKQVKPNTIGDYFNFLKNK